MDLHVTSEIMMVTWLGVKMGDLGGDVLIDVSRVPLRELLTQVDGSGLAHVLARIISPGQDGGLNGFNSSI